MDLIYSNQFTNPHQPPATLMYDTSPTTSHPPKHQFFPATLTSSFSPGSVDDNTSTYDSQSLRFSSSSLPDYYGYHEPFPGFSSPPTHSEQDIQNDISMQDCSQYDPTYATPFNNHVGSSPQPFDFSQKQTSNHYGYELSPIENTLSSQVPDSFMISQSPQSVYSLESNVTPPMDMHQLQPQLIPNMYPEQLAGIDPNQYHQHQHNLAASTSSRLAGHGRSRSHNIVGHTRARRSSSVPPISVQGGIRPRRQNRNSLKAHNHPAAYVINPLSIPAQTRIPILPPVQIERVAPRQHGSSLSQSANNSHRASHNKPSHQKRLDDQLERVNFDDITVSELKDFLRALNLSASGRKADLMGRLKEAHKDMLERRAKKTTPVSPPSPQIESENIKESIHHTQPISIPKATPPVIMAPLSPRKSIPNNRNNISSSIEQVAQEKLLSNPSDIHPVPIIVPSQCPSDFRPNNVSRPSFGHHSMPTSWQDNDTSMLTAPLSTSDYQGYFETAPLQNINPTTYAPIETPESYNYTPTTCMPVDTTMQLNPSMPIDTNLNSQVGGVSISDMSPLENGVWDENMFNFFTNFQS
ncbi:hypothetical protein F4703DRAFT_1835209 [Phycomyces blakesleeanus]